MGIKQLQLHEAKRQAGQPTTCATCGAPSVGKLAKPDRHGRAIHYCAVHTPHDVIRFRQLALGAMLRGAAKRRRRTVAAAAA